MSHCSVVMVSHGSGPMLLAAIKSVLRQEKLAELILVDAGTPLNMLARLQQMALTEPRLKIHAVGNKINEATACNIGARETSGDLLAFVNPDCLLPPRALADMMSAFSSVPGAILAGCNVVGPDASLRETGRVQTFTPEVAISETVLMRDASKRVNIATGAAPYAVESVPATFLCIRKEDYMKLGGMDEAFAYAAHLDLCKRIRAHGGTIICVPAMSITYMKDEINIPLPRREEWSRARGYIRYFKKHFAEESVPGFLLLLNTAILLRYIYRVIWRKIKLGYMPKHLMLHSVAAKRLMILASGLAELPEKKDWYGKTVLVTGATSQTGLCVIRRLISQGAAVLALSRSEPIPYTHEHLRWLKGDLTDADLNLQDYLVDMVVHCAPLWTLPPAIEKLATTEVKRIVAFGTTSVFGKALSHNAHEKNMVHRLAMAEEKLAELCREKSIDWTILRPTLTYGVGLDLGITSIAKCIDRYGRFPVYPPAFGRRQPVHADDLAIAVTQVAESRITYGKSYNISGGEVLTFYQMLERIFTVCGKPAKIYKTTLLPFMLSVAGFVTRKKHINGEIARRMNDDLIFFHDDATRDFAFDPRLFLSGGMKDIEGF